MAGPGLQQRFELAFDKLQEREPKRSVIENLAGLFSAYSDESPLTLASVGGKLRIEMEGHSFFVPDHIKLSETISNYNIAKIIFKNTTQKNIEKLLMPLIKGENPLGPKYGKWKSIKFDFRKIVPGEPASSPSLDTQEMMERAQSYMRKKDLDSALKIYKVLLKALPDPEKVAAKISKIAQRYYERGNPDSALKIYQYLLESFPSPKVIAQLTGLAGNRKTDDMDFAAKIYLLLFEKKITLKTVIDRLMAIAKSYAKDKSDFDAALKIYALLSNYDPQRWIPQLTKTARFYSREKKDPDSALKVYRIILEHEPNNKLILMGIGNQYRKLGMPQEAIPYYEKVRELYPDDIKALSALANCYKRLEDHEKAILYLRKVLEAEPKNIITLTELGLCHKKMGQYQKAITCFEQVLELSHKNLDSIALLMLAECHSSSNHPKKAYEYFQLFLTAKPNDKSVLYRTAYLAFEFGDYQNALKYAEKLSKACPDSPGNLNLYGDCLRKLSRYPEAITVFQKSLKLSEGETDDHTLKLRLKTLSGLGYAHNSLARRLSNKKHIIKHLKLSIKYFLQTESISNINGEQKPRTLCGLGFSYLDLAAISENKVEKSKYFTLAEECFKKALDMDPNYKKALRGMQRLKRCRS